MKRKQMGDGKRLPSLSQQTDNGGAACTVCVKSLPGDSDFQSHNLRPCFQERSAHMTLRIKASLAEPSSPSPLLLSLLLPFAAVAALSICADVPAMCPHIPFIPFTFIPPHAPSSYRRVYLQYFLERKKCIDFIKSYLVVKTLTILRGRTSMFSVSKPRVSCPCS